MLLTSVTKDPATLTLTVVGDYPVPQQRPWDAFTQFSSIEAMEQTVPGMEEGLRAAMPQLDALLTELEG